MGSADAHNAVVISHANLPFDRAGVQIICSHRSIRRLPSLNLHAIVLEIQAFFGMRNALRIIRQCTRPRRSCPRSRRTSLHHRAGRERLGSAATAATGTNTSCGEISNQCIQTVGAELEAGHPAFAGLDRRLYFVSTEPVANSRKSGNTTWLTSAINTMTYGAISASKSARLARQPTRRQISDAIAPEAEI